MAIINVIVAAKQGILYPLVLPVQTFLKTLKQAKIAAESSEFPFPIESQYINMFYRISDVTYYYLP